MAEKQNEHNHKSTWIRPSGHGSVWSPVKLHDNDVEYARVDPPAAPTGHEHRWVGRGEYGDTSSGYMCADCGVDLDDTPESASAAPAERDRAVAQGVVREWTEHDMNEHYNSDYLRDEFGSEHLEQRIAAALATVRQEVETRMRSACVAVAKDFNRMNQDDLWRKYGTVMLIDALEAVTLDQQQEKQ